MCQEAGRPLFFFAALAESVSCLTCSFVKRFSLELAVFAALDWASALDRSLPPADPLPLLEPVSRGPSEADPDVVPEDIAGSRIRSMSLDFFVASHLSQAQRTYDLSSFGREISTR